MSDKPRTTRLRQPQPEASAPEQAAAPAPKSRFASMFSDRTVVQQQRPTPPRSPFVFAWHPRRWTVLDGRVVPLLAQFSMEAGKHGLEALRSGKISRSYFRENLATRGYTEIDPEQVEYLDELAPGVWGASWERLTPSGQIVSDRAAYLDWLESLMAQGVVPRPDAGVIDDLLSMKRQERQHLAGKPGVEHFTAAMDAEIQALERAQREAA